MKPANTATNTVHKRGQQVTVTTSTPGPTPEELRQVPAIDWKARHKFRGRGRAARANAAAYLNLIEASLKQAPRVTSELSVPMETWDVLNMLADDQGIRVETLVRRILGQFLYMEPPAS